MKDRFLGGFEALFLGLITGWNINVAFSNPTYWAGYVIVLCCIVLIINFLTRRKYGR